MDELTHGLVRRFVDFRARTPRAAVFRPMSGADFSQARGELGPRFFTESFFKKSAKRAGQACSTHFSLVWDNSRWHALMRPTLFFLFFLFFLVVHGKNRHRKRRFDSFYQSLTWMVF